MTGLDNLTNKIIIQAKKEAETIVDEANKKIASEMKILEDDLTKEINRKKVKLESERNLIIERLKSSAQLKARNDKLKAKQDIINRVFDEVLNELRNMNDDDYLNYIKSQNLSNTLKLIVVKEKYNLVKDNLREYDVDDKNFVDSGFIAVNNDIENNYTFETRINFLRQEIEGHLAKILFHKE